MHQRIIAVPILVLASSLFLMLATAFVEASTIYPSDDGGWPKDYFYANEAVYVSGDLDPMGAGDIPIPRARVYVTEDLEWNGWEAIEDVSLHGYYSGYNVVIGNMAGGSFLGALVWGPPLKLAIMT